MITFVHKAKEEFLVLQCVLYRMLTLLITSLFFHEGFAHSILDLLNNHFQDAMEISKTCSAFIQAVLYGGYSI